MISITQTKGTTTAAAGVQTDPTALAANPARLAWGIQNVGTNPLFVSLGGTASASVFNKILIGGSGDSDAHGGSWDQDSGVVYTGAITVYSSSDQKYAVYELAN